MHSITTNGPKKSKYGNAEKLAADSTDDKERALCHRPGSVTTPGSNISPNYGY